MPQRTRLAEVIEKHAHAEGRTPTAIQALDLFRGPRMLAWAPVVYEPSICILARGRKEVLIGDSVDGYDTDHFAVVSVELPLVCRVLEPVVGLQLRFDPMIVSECLATRPGRPSMGSAAGWMRTPVDKRVLNASLRLVRLLDEPDLLPSLAPLTIREIVHRVLSGPLGDRLRRAATSGDPAHCVARAAAWIKENAAEAVRVEVLADRVGMGRSAFHRRFKTVMGTSPIQYQKRVRLLEAKRLMVGTGTSASEAAARVGYASSAHFSRDYRRLFGVPPARDVSELRRIDG